MRWASCFCDSSKAASGRSRSDSVRYGGAILAGVAVRRTVTRQSHARSSPPVSDKPGDHVGAGQVGSIPITRCQCPKDVTN